MKESYWVYQGRRQGEKEKFILQKRLNGEGFYYCVKEVEKYNFYHCRGRIRRKEEEMEENNRFLLSHREEDGKR